MKIDKLAPVWFQNMCKILTFECFLSHPNSLVFLSWKHPSSFRLFSSIFLKQFRRILLIMFFFFWESESKFHPYAPQLLLTLFFSRQTFLLISYSRKLGGTTRLHQKSSLISVKQKTQLTRRKMQITNQQVKLLRAVKCFKLGGEKLFSVWVVLL